MSMPVAKPREPHNVVLVEPDITAGHATFVGATSAYR